MFCAARTAACNGWLPNSQQEMRCCLYSSGSKSAIRRSDAGKWPAFIKHVPNTNAPDSSVLNGAVAHLKRSPTHQLRLSRHRHCRCRPTTMSLLLKRLSKSASKLTRSKRPLTYASVNAVAEKQDTSRHPSPPPPANQATRHWKRAHATFILVERGSSAS